MEPEYLPIDLAAYACILHLLRFSNDSLLLFEWKEEKVE